MKKPLPPKRPNTNYVPVLMGVFVLVLAALMYNMYRAQVFSRLYRFPFLNSPKPTPTPTPIVLPPGKETYSVSQGPHTGPTIMRVTFDPLDVRKGKKLTIQVAVQEISPVLAVTAKLRTDGGTQEFSLKRIGESQNEGIWQGEVTPEHSLWYTYVLTVLASDKDGESQAIIAPRA